MVADARARQPLDTFDINVELGDPRSIVTPSLGSEVRPLLIAIPFFKGEQLVGPLTQSLLKCADEIRALHGEIILFNDSPDYEPLAAALDQALADLGGAVPTRIKTNPRNLGFVRTMNRAIAEAVERRFDVLLLNSDTVVFPGALREMARVAASDPMIAFVNPRSNNATLATLPAQDRFQGLSQEAAYDAWRQVSAYLPDVAYVPTAVGFCLLCRWKVLAEFGGFDEIYGAGYHEENDLIMRANRCGYRAALANKAFVWHEGATSFSLLEETKAKRDLRNEAILLSRYPEYASLVSDHFDSPEYHAEQLIGALIPDEGGKLEIAFDLSAFGPYHNGTFAAGRQLLLAAAGRWRGKFKLFAICSREAYVFHDFAALGVQRRDPEGRARYAAVFRIGQPYTIGEIDRLATQAAVIGVYMLDTISIDCGELYSPRLYNLWQFILEHGDLIATTSKLSTDQLERRFQIGDAVRIRAMHSVDLEDYARLGDGPASRTESPLFDQPYLLVVGNKFAHKYVAETANALSDAYPNYAIVALGVNRSDDGASSPGRVRLKDAPNLFVTPVGDLTSEAMTRLYQDAHAVVFPTHYEGFGFPLLDALAARTPIFARRNAALEEVWLLQGSSPNVHFFDLTSELVRMLEGEVMWTAATEAPRIGGDADQSADEILVGLEQALQRASYSRITKRVRAIQFINDIANDEVSKRSQTLVREARGLSKRLAAAQAETAALREHFAAMEQTLGSQMLKWTRRRLSRLPWMWRPLHQSIYALLRNLKPAPSAPMPAEDPTAALIAQSGFFDASWYLAKYEDVALAGADPLSHFVSQALEERRDPGPHFSTAYYLEQWPEVFDIGMNPLEHYLTVGQTDGAKPRR